MSAPFFDDPNIREPPADSDDILVQIELLSERLSGIERRLSNLQWTGVAIIGLILVISVWFRNHIPGLIP